MMSSSEEEEEEEEENVSDMKTLTSGGGDLPQEFWQVSSRAIDKYYRYIECYSVSRAQ